MSSVSHLKSGGIIVHYDNGDILYLHLGDHISMSDCKSGLKEVDQIISAVPCFSYAHHIIRAELHARLGNIEQVANLNR